MEHSDKPPTCGFAIGPNTYGVAIVEFHAGVFLRPCCLRVAASPTAMASQDPESRPRQYAGERQKKLVTFSGSSSVPSAV